MSFKLNMFKLTSSKLITLTWLVPVITTIIFYFFYEKPRLISDIIKISEEESLKIGNHYVNEHFRGDLDSFKSKIPHMLDETKYHGFIKLWKVRLFNDSGRMLYSTIENEDNVNIDKKMFTKMVKNGVLYSKIVKKGNLSKSLSKVDINVVETYVPIMKNGKFFGAFEIYLDVDQHIVKMNKSILSSTYLFVIIMVVIGMLIFWISKYIMKIEKNREQVLVELQDAHLKIEQSQKKYKSLFDNTGTPMIIVSENYEIILGNNEFFELAAITNIDSRLTPSLNLFVDDKIIGQLDKLFKEYYKIDKGNIKSFNNKSNINAISTKFTNLNGEKFSIEIIVRCMSFENNNVFLLSINDITQKKKLDNFFAETVEMISCQKDHELFASIVSGMLNWFNADTAILGVISENGCTIKALSAFENNWPMQNVTYDMHEGSSIKYVIDKGFCYFNEKAYKKFSQDKLITKIKGEGFLGIPIVNNDNASIGVFIVVTKNELVLHEFTYNLLSIISTLVSMEIERKETQRELLDNQRKAVRSDRLKSLGEMSSAMAHEFNQPLCAIRAYSENILLCKQRNWEVTDDEIIDNLTKINELIDNMSGLIEHVREFSNNADINEITEVDVVKVIESALSILHVQFISKGIEIVVVKPYEGIFIKANPYTVEEILLEILFNARDAILDMVKEDKNINKRIEIIVKKDSTSKRVKINITDTGIGMAEETCIKIFDPFFSEKGLGRGSGLGMTTALNFTKSFNGSITVNSVLYKGTCVLLDFPLYHPKNQCVEKTIS